MIRVLTFVLNARDSTRAKVSVPAQVLCAVKIIHTLTPSSAPP